MALEFPVINILSGKISIQNIYQINVKSSMGNLALSQSHNLNVSTVGTSDGLNPVGAVQQNNPGDKKESKLFTFSPQSFLLASVLLRSASAFFYMCPSGRSKKWVTH